MVLYLCLCFFIDGEIPEFDIANYQIDTFFSVLSSGNFDYTQLAEEDAPSGANEIYTSNVATTFTKLVRPRKVGYRRVRKLDKQESRFQFYIKFKLYIIARIIEWNKNSPIYIRGSRGRMLCIFIAR